MKRAIVLAVAALGGCSSSSSGISSSSGAMPSGPGANSLAQGFDVYDVPSDVTIDWLFADNGVVSVLSDDSQSVSLTKVGSQTPVFTTPMSDGVGSITMPKLAVAVAAGSAFYTSQGALHAVSMQTGTDQVLGMPGSCIPMFADATAVFCALDTMVLSFSLPQGTMQMVADLSPSKADDLYADATTLYMAASPSSHAGVELWTAPRAGGTATMLATANAGESDFHFLPGQADDANVYLGIANGYARMSKSTHQIDVVSQGGALASGFGSAYISGAYFYSSSSETLTRGPLATGMPAMAIAATTTDMIGLDNIAVTGGSAYWVSFVQSVSHEIVARAPLPN